MLDLSLAGEPSQLPKRLCLTLNFSIVGGGELLDCSALAFRGDPKQIIEPGTVEGRPKAVSIHQRGRRPTAASGCAFLNKSEFVVACDEVQELGMRTSLCYQHKMLIP